MKFGETWLREWVSSRWDTAALCEQLTMAGLEVDGVEPAAPAFDHVVVAQVLSVEKHPEADKLNVCQVDTGSERLTIVCGAANVRAGLRVPCALVGASLPGGMHIKKAKLRGVESSGMLCSASELGLAESASGLLELPNDAPLGVSIRDYLQLDDHVVDIDFTPNRGDCLSVRGLAREIAVLDNAASLTQKLFPAVASTIADRFEVIVEAPGDCPVYLGRVIKGVDPTARTPLWMQERLRRAGLRSISALVDVTNYVLLELGQPMHAFDLDKLSGAIVIRRAKKAEKLKLLDESEIELDSDCLVVADKKAAQAFAGVMGGFDSAVGASTRNLFLECAFFNPDTIRGRARRFGLQTDSSYRFERGVDFALQRQAMERATQLIVEIAGGKAGSVVDVTAAAKLPVRNTITLRKARLDRVLGIELDNATVGQVLKRLGMELELIAEGWRVIPPSYRYDIVIEADLIEEVGRVYGYNRIPTVLPRGDLTIAPRPEAQVADTRLRAMLVDRAYNEAITYSFVDPAIQKMIDPAHEPVVLSNPISSEMSVMRTTLWSGLLRALGYNIARQQHRVRLFEIGRRFIKEGDTVRQEAVVSGVVYGGAAPKHWDGAQANADFFDVKGDVEAILGLTHSSGDFIFRKDHHPALHPGQSASITKNGEQLGWLGTIHPRIQKELDFAAPAVLFEIALETYRVGVVPQFNPLSKYPSIQRDLALVVDVSIPAAQVVALAAKSGGTRLKSVEVFDVYHGKGVADGKKSLAVSLTIQDDRQTLTDPEVEDLIRGVLDSLKTAVGATLRD